jgi:hypothetical protein
MNYSRINRGLISRRDASNTHILPCTALPGGVIGRRCRARPITLVLFRRVNGLYRNLGLVERPCSSHREYPARTAWEKRGRKRDDLVT